MGFESLAGGAHVVTNFAFGMTAARLSKLVPTDLPKPATLLLAALAAFAAIGTGFVQMQQLALARANGVGQKARGFAGAE